MVSAILFAIHIQGSRGTKKTKLDGLSNRTENNVVIKIQAALTLDILDHLYYFVFRRSQAWMTAECIIACFFMSSSPGGEISVQPQGQLIIFANQYLLCRNVR